MAGTRRFFTVSAPRPRARGLARIGGRALLPWAIAACVALPVLAVVGLSADARAAEAEHLNTTTALLGKGGRVVMAGDGYWLAQVPGRPPEVGARSAAMLSARGTKATWEPSTGAWLVVPASGRGALRVVAQPTDPVDGNATTLLAVASTRG